MNRIPSAPVVVAGLLLILLTGTSVAQAPSRDNILRATATVALLPSLPAGYGSAMIVRRTTEYPRDVILLREDATAEQMSAAVVALIRARNRDGVLAVRDTIIAVTRTVGPNSWRGGETVRVAKWLDRIRMARNKPLPGIGDVKSAQILLRSARVSEASLGS